MIDTTITAITIAECVQLSVKQLSEVALLFYEDKEGFLFRILKVINASCK